MSLANNSSHSRSNLTTISVLDSLMLAGLILTGVWVLIILTILYV